MKKRRITLLIQNYGLTDMLTVKEMTVAMVTAKINKMFDSLKLKYPALNNHKITVGECKGSALGKAYPCRKGKYNHYIAINFDNMLTSDAAWEEGYDDTIPHEVAHIAAFIVFGTLDHGSDWRFFCEELGMLYPERTCTAQIANMSRKHKYVVAGNTTSVTTVVHNRIQRGTHVYRLGGVVVNAYDYVGLVKHNNITKIPAKYSKDFKF